MEGNMKKLLYVSFGNANLPGRGVSKKIYGQIAAFKKQGYDCSFISGYDSDVVVRTNDGADHVIRNERGGVRYKVCRWCVQHADQIGYVYIRFQFFDPMVYRALKAFKRHGASIVMEIPTFPYEDELKIQGLKGKPKLLVDRWYRNKCATLIDRFVCPLFDKPILGTPTIRIRNGIDMASSTPRTPSLDASKIRLLAVASMSRWHGFERLIEGLRRYYSETDGQKREIVFNVVGEGVELAKYKELTKSYGLEDRVVFWGRRFGDDLEKAYNESDIGISSLGMHRLNTEISNPLKTVEYLAKGTPVVCGDGEASIPDDSPYRLTVPFDDSPIQIEEIIRFYDRVYHEKDVEQVANEIRKFCEETCSMDSAMKPVVDFFQSR